MCVCVGTWSRRLLYSDCGNDAQSTVRACNLTAANCAVLFNRTHCVHDLHLDTDVNTVYWIEADNVMSHHLDERRTEFIKSVF